MLPLVVSAVHWWSSALTSGEHVEARGLAVEQAGDDERQMISSAEISSTQVPTALIAGETPKRIEE